MIRRDSLRRRVGNRGDQAEAFVDQQTVMQEPNSARTTYAGPLRVLIAIMPDLKRSNSGLVRVWAPWKEASLRLFCYDRMGSGIQFVKKDSALPQPWLLFYAEQAEFELSCGLN